MAADTRPQTVAADTRPQTVAPLSAEEVATMREFAAMPDHDRVTLTAKDARRFLATIDAEREAATRARSGHRPSADFEDGSGPVCVVDDETWPCTRARSGRDAGLRAAVIYGYQRGEADERYGRGHRDALAADNYIAEQEARTALSSGEAAPATDPWCRCFGQPPHPHTGPHARPRHDPTDHDCRGGVKGDLYPESPEAAPVDGLREALRRASIDAHNAYRELHERYGLEPGHDEHFFECRAPICIERAALAREEADDGRS